MRSDKIASDNCVLHTPFTLFPSPIPSRLYQLCLDIHPYVTNLMLQLANNLAFMEDSLSSIVQVDDFTRNLLKVQQTVEREGLSQSILSCINRSDYMLDTFTQTNQSDSIRIRQVEVNAIASALSTHSCKIKDLHHFLMNKYNLQPATNISFPNNDSLEFIASELIRLYDLYGQKDSFILLINEPRSLNFSEHFTIEYTIHKSRPDIRIIRRRFKDLPNAVTIGPNKQLLLDDNIEIGLVYFRYCYDPSNYDFPEAWNIRLLLERSKAIKCPSIGFHVSGIKKFQQLLSEQSQLEKFLESDQAKKLTEVMCKFWPIDNDTESGRDGFRIGLEPHRNLVLKPQREGGGHNIYGKNVRTYLGKIENSDDRRQYILMEMINSPTEKNWLMHPEDNVESDKFRLDSHDLLVSELGIYGSIVADKSTILSNQSAGYLVRSKKSGVDEGGVVSGYSGISSVMLIDDNEVDLTQFYQF